MSLNELKAIFLHVVKDNYFNFEGRASRYEYWWFFLINLVISGVCNILDYTLGIAICSAIVSLALLCPGLGVCVRRLHDINRSGWWVLLAAIPLIGGIILIVWLATKGDAAANEYGEVPTDEYAQAA
ncbi:MAG: DUF805 domain-containing protein [Paludibacteraceae bacterium]|nr:DUF805 domain-containing protein [Paludibacteraceae bacterium]